MFIYINQRLWSQFRCLLKNNLIEIFQTSISKNHAKIIVFIDNTVYLKYIEYILYTHFVFEHFITVVCIIIKKAVSNNKIK